MWNSREEIWKTAKHNMIEALFPRRCPVCGDVVDVPKAWICPDCIGELQIIQEPVCKICGRPLHDELAEHCNNCQRHRYSFEYGMVLMEYNAVAANSMAAIKYHGAREYLEYYAVEVVKQYGEAIRRLQPDAIVPVPVHAARLRKRGYNQAGVLADLLGTYLDIPVYEDALIRNKKTVALKELGAADRLKSLECAFCAKNIPEELRTVLLVDDIFTTGATMEACTRALKSGGVERVYVFALCASSDS